MSKCSNCGDKVDQVILGDDNMEYCFGCATVSELLQASAEDPDNVPLKAAATTAAASRGILDPEEY